MSPQPEIMIFVLWVYITLVLFQYLTKPTEP